MDPDSARKWVRETNYASWRRQEGWEPLLVVRAEGNRFWDSEGKEYLDFASQIVAVNLGHGNPAVIGAIRRQSETLAFAAPGFSTEPRAELSRRLAEVLPDGLGRYFFSTGGAEANECALKIARTVTGRAFVLSRRRSYHGATAGAISVTGDLRGERLISSAKVPGTIFAPDCYCYRCPLALSYPSCGIACAEEVDGLLAQRSDVAAMIVEPVVGTNGAIVPVPEYLPRIREITRRHGVLLIADEVMTGWGRTGAWFAVDHYGVVPDLLTTAKGITSGYAPLGLTASTPSLHHQFRERYFPHGHTYEAHPLALAAASATIDEYRRLGLVARANREGQYLLARLRELEDRHPSVGEVRGIGLLCAIELVRDRRRREPFNTPEDVYEGRPLVVDMVAAAARRAGVHLLGWISHLIVAPPLTVEREEVDRAVGVLDAALELADRRVAPPRGT